MLDEPLGRAETYRVEIQAMLDEDEDVCRLLSSKDEGMANKQRRYLVNYDHNMVIPKDKAINELLDLKLPVYIGDFGDHKCHFRDVSKRLYRMALQEC